MKYSLFPPQAIYELGQRSNQEDNIYPAFGQATADDRLFIVCDGMGGHEHGEVASQAVVNVLSNYIAQHHHPSEPFSDQLLTKALDQAYAELDALDTDEVRKMGTTLTFILFHRGGVTAAHIGDSRIYHLRPNEGEILYCSRDHSLVMDLYQAGEITRDEMRTSPQKNVITRALSPGADNRTRADIVHITDVKPGDYFYLCSDGMLEQMDDDELLALLAYNTTDAEKCQALIQATVDNKDNHSAYLIRVESVQLEAGDDSLLNDEYTSRANVINLYREREAQDAADVSVVAQPPHRPREIPVDASTTHNSPSKIEEMGDSMLPSKRFQNRKPLLIAIVALLLGLLLFLYCNRTKPISPIAAPIESETQVKSDSSNAAATGTGDNKKGNGNKDTMLLWQGLSFQRITIPPGHQ